MPRKLFTKEWVAKARQRWGKKFDYSRVVYRGNTIPVEIGCPVHGWIHITPKNHFLNRASCTGCQLCGREATARKNTTFTPADLLRKTKVCQGCKKELPTDAFSKKRSGYTFPRCKTCMRGAVRIEKECEVCQDVFESTDKSRKRFCSLACNRIALARITLGARREARAKRDILKDRQRKQNRLDFPEIFEKFKALPCTLLQAKKENSLLYFTGLKCSNNHLAPRRVQSRLCLSCGRDRGRESYLRSKEDGRYEAKRERDNAIARRRRSEDPVYRARLNARARRWQDNNRRHLAKYMRRLRRESPQIAIRQRLDSRLNYILKKGGNTKQSSLEMILGCSCKDLVKWIESQFTSEMSWENRSQWNVDHIRPCASFDLTDPEQVKTCFNWRNLRPLGEIENKSKQARYSQEDEAAWAETMRELEYKGELFLLFDPSE